MIGTLDSLSWICMTEGFFCTVSLFSYFYFFIFEFCAQVLECSDRGDKIFI
jgi:hypothetical protein